METRDIITQTLINLLSKTVTSLNRQSTTMSRSHKSMEFEKNEFYSLKVITM